MIYVAAIVLPSSRCRKRLLKRLRHDREAPTAGRRDPRRCAAGGNTYALEPFCGNRYARRRVGGGRVRRVRAYRDDRYKRNVIGRREKEREEKNRK